MISFSIATEKWSDQAKRLLRETGRDAGEVLKQEGRLFLQDCVKLTPPTSKQPFTESYNVQRRAGENAISNDIKKLFIDWQTLGVMQNNTRLRVELQKYAAAGDLVKATTLLQRVGVKMPVILEVIPSLHVSGRGAGGRTLRSRKHVVLRSEGIPRYIKTQQKKVGIEKSGWLTPANALGVKLPAWITRHTGAPGLWRDDTRGSENPSITMGNLVGYAQEHGRRLAVIKRALDRRVESLTKRIDAMLKKRFREA